MNRRAALAAILALGTLFAAGAGVLRGRLEAEAATTVPATLLYLPKGPFLRALAFGQEQSLADLLYIWSIQYYSSYDDPQVRHAYLEQVYAGAITELDPRFTEAYLVGALIMSIEAGQSDRALRLFNKGLERMPDNWELAYWAGWECYDHKRYDCARDYWDRAAHIPKAPPQLVRLAARMIEKSGDEAGAIREYERILAETKDDATRAIVAKWLDKARTDFVLAQVRGGIKRFRAAQGRCPASLGELARPGQLAELPAWASEVELRYERATCGVAITAGSSFQGAR